jgi:flagellar biosynthesis protein FlhF
MQIKRFEAPSVQEALQFVKRDLGPEAVILYTKRVKRGGFLGFLSSDMIEVTAGVDVPVLEDTKKTPVLAPKNLIQKRPILKPEVQPEEKNRRETISVTLTPPMPSPVRERERERERRDPVFNSELNEGKVMASMTQMKPSQSFTVKAEKEKNWHPEVLRYEKALLKAGCEDDAIKRVLEQVNEEISERGYPRSGTLYPMIQQKLAAMLKVSGPIDCVPGKARVVAFIGPTGVGKTTTLVKLASQYSLVHQKRVALITADTYRIGAVEQLKIYRDIIDIPLEAVSTPDELDAVIKRMADRDLIFMDTAGRSPLNRPQIQDMRGFLEVAKPAETHLVISATTKNGDLLPIVAKFGLVPINRFLFTKLDETKSYGLFLNLASNFNIPVSYVTTGQMVPDDVEIATPERLADLVLGEKHARPS